MTWLQQRLAGLQFLAAGQLNGRYDEATAQAVAAFQRTNDLIEDGVVGAQTWQALASNRALAHA